MGRRSCQNDGMESAQFILFRLLPPLALLAFLAGALKLILSWRKTPVPLDRGLAGGLGGGARSAPLAWRGYFPVFHLLGSGSVYLCLGVLAARHARYFMTPAPEWSPYWAGPSQWAGFLLVLLIAFFWMRTMLDERAALLTGWREHLALGAFLLCALSGVALRWWGGLDPAIAQATAGGMFLFRDTPLPRAGFLFGLHFSSALALLVLFPHNALPRLAARFFNPALRPANAGRRKNPWAAEYAGDQVSPASTLAGEPEPYTLEKYRTRLKEHWRESGSGQVTSAEGRRGETP